MNLIIEVMPLILIIFLIIGSFYDLLNDMTIPMPVGVIGIGIRATELIILEREQTLNYIITALILCFIFFVGAIMGAYGGADIIFTTMIGLFLGMDGVIAVGLGCILSLPHAFYVKKIKKEDNSAFPFVPYLLLSTSIIVIFRFMLGGKAIW